MREELSHIFVLNYHTLQQSFEFPLEFSFLDKEEISDLLKSNRTQKETVLKFFEIPFNRKEQERVIIRPLNKKSENHKRVDCCEQILHNFGFQLHECWTFEGNSKKWNEFILKNIYPMKKAIIWKPSISIQLDSFSAPISLQPAAIIYYKKKFILLLQTHSKNIGKSFSGAFVFYVFFFKNYLKLEFSEAAAFYSEARKEIQYYLSISTLKTPKNSTTNLAYIPIYKILEKEKVKYEDSIFSEFLTEREYDQLFFTNFSKESEDNFFDFTSKLDRFKTQLEKRLKELDNLAVFFYTKLPETLEISTWYENIDWGKLISIKSLKTNYSESKKLGLFSAEGKIFKTAISLLYPKFPILWSSLIDIRKAFLLIEKNNLQIDSNYSKDTFNNFLSCFFYNSELVEEKRKLRNSIFSIEGKKLFWEKILNIKWKIYYDFESWETMLTQLSLQIFKGKELISQKDLIRDPFGDTENFHKQCLRELSQPICTVLEGLNQSLTEESEVINFLKGKVVYISFNKTFECTWLTKISQLFNLSKDLKNSLLCNLIRDLTVDLSDWFKFSATSSLNIIGPLLGSHTLKKLSGIVQAEKSKKYSQMQWAQDGRSASLLYLYFYREIFNIEDEKNMVDGHLAPTHWIRQEQEKKLREWSLISSFLKEYCYYDVQNMVDGVNWLRENYEKNESWLVAQSKILETISHFKKLRAPQLGELIINYLDFQTSC